MVILARRENSRNSSSKSSSQFSVDRPAPTPVLEVVQGRNRSSQQGSERQRCRQCRSKLPAPTDIPQYAFCTPFCWRQFYSDRCLVCEEPILRRAEHQKTCIRRECKNELRRYPHLYRLRKGIQGSQNVVTPLRSADKTGTKSALASNRGRIVAPAHVLQVELFDRTWESRISTGGVPIQVGRLRQRTLVGERETGAVR